MFAYKTGHRVVQACLVLFFCLCAMSKVFASDVLVPESNADYGSGSSACSLYYPGGIPRIGLSLGQPNTSVRNDRALVRFSISPCLLSASPVKSATLCFRIAGFGAPEDSHEIQITHLSYDADSLSANDLVNSRAEIVASVSVMKKDNEPTDTNKEHTLDVTKYVNADIANGHLYSAFRFRDVTAETKERVDLTGKYSVSLKKLLQLKLR
jgi:hypothetical protein